MKQRAWLQLAASWFVLNLTVNVTFPASDPSFGWCQPSWEAAVIVLGYAGWIARGRAISPWTHRSLVAVLLLVRLFRFVDGFYIRFFHREFRVALDTPLLPESIRLLVATDGWARALAELALVVALVLGFVWLLRRSLGALETNLRQLLRRQPPQRSLNVGTCLLLGAVSLLPLPFSKGSVEASASARVLTELRFLADYDELRARTFARFEKTAADVASSPQNLKRLAQRDVTLIVIESYGRGALETRQHAKPMSQALRTFAEQAAGGGRMLASHWLLPPTYGGGSWYAHATLSTGVKVWTPLDYNLLLDSQVTPLSRYMQLAGYHTLNVMPGTTRVWPQETFFGFDERLYAKDFHYRGPWVSWGRFPDQYVLDQVRHKYGNVKQPLYKEIKLVSSHVPWRAVPPVVKDWERIGDGSVYHDLPIRHRDIKWSQLKQAHWPYIDSILYDLAVVGDYVQHFEDPSALLIVLGDHQAVREASQSPSWHVPVHVAGPDDLVSQFVGAGFTPGVRPEQSATALPMEQFLPLFLKLCSLPAETASIQFRSTVPIGAD